MAAGGLTGAGGGSIAGTAPPPLQKQPDSALLTSYAKAGAPKPDVPMREGGGGKAGADTKAGHLGDGWAQSEEQSQKLQDFDAVKGRPSLGDERRGDGQEGGEKREGSFVGCAAGAAKDVVVDTVKGAYETVKDAGGAVLDKAGVDGYEGHTERTADRVDAVVDGGKKVVGAGVDAGGAVLDKAGVGGFEGHSERTAARAETVKDAVVDEGAEIMAEIEKGDSCALGERVGTTVGVGATVVIPGGAAVKGAKVLTKIGGRDGADGPDAKPDAQDAGKAEKAEANDAGKVEETKKTSVRPKVSVGHILDGDINAKGKAGGFHHRTGGVDSPDARMKQRTEPEDMNGVYKGKVEIRDPDTGNWVEKKADSTFYPDRMSRDQVVQSIENAWDNKTGFDSKSGRFEGPSGEGFDIIGYARNGEIKTAYPDYVE